MWSYLSYCLKFQTQNDIVFQYDPKTPWGDPADKIFQVFIAD